MKFADAFLDLNLSSDSKFNPKLAIDKLQDPFMSMVSSLTRGSASRGARTLGEESLQAAWSMGSWVLSLKTMRLYDLNSVGGVGNGVGG